MLPPSPARPHGPTDCRLVTDTIAIMAGPPENPGLRERKKRATRARLIDAAVDLVDKQGYLNTTVEQIANAVDVSPRTVAHYFPSKDRLLLSLVDTYIDTASALLADVPDHLPPLLALLECNLQLLDRMAAQQPPTDARRLATLLCSLHASPPLQQLSATIRTPPLIAEMARRLGTTPEDRRVELTLAVWWAMVGNAWSGVSSLYVAGTVDTAGLPDLLKQRLFEEFDHLVGLGD